jgi:hypothetical protein
MKSETVVLPKTLGAAADKLYDMRAARLKAQAAVDKLHDKEKELQEHIKIQLTQAHAEGVEGKKARVGITLGVVADVQDWDEYYKWVKKTGDFSLFMRKLNDGSCRERWENKEVIPGVQPQTILKVSVTKR